MRSLCPSLRRQNHRFHRLLEGYITLKAPITLENPNNCEDTLSLVVPQVCVFSKKMFRCLVSHVFSSWKKKRAFGIHCKNHNRVLLAESNVGEWLATIIRCVELMTNSRFEEELVLQVLSRLVRLFRSCASPKQGSPILPRKQPLTIGEPML
jgi:hypothetical protein